MKNDPLPRLDTNSQVRERLLPFCRLQLDQIWQDPNGNHRVACADATDERIIHELVADARPSLAIHDPPYNVAAFETRTIDEYVAWCQRWITLTHDVLAADASLYVWLGADQNDGFQPLADFMVMMRSQPFRSRSFITMRNQRGYGTQKNWMALRQELLYYVKGDPAFNIDAEYTEIPKILRGYYKTVNGRLTENLERGRASTIRAGNVWVDVQQVFYRMEENVSGCYAQKPIKSIERIIRASSAESDIVIDLFSHSGTTLLAAELLGRTCLAADIDPVFCEITIRRLEHFRRTGRLGWQNGHPFEDEIHDFFGASGDVEDLSTIGAVDTLF
ncbi:MAG: site-specific DNA-methyltransferase [Planctomycetota bacterium]